MTAFGIFSKLLRVAAGTFPHTSSAGLISLDFIRTIVLDTELCWCNINRMLSVLDHFWFIFRHNVLSYASPS